MRVLRERAGLVDVVANLEAGEQKQESRWVCTGGES